MKPTILMIPSWWPKNGSVGGSFFREQALALSENFNITILLYEEKRIFAPLFFLRKLFFCIQPKITFLENDNNLPVFFSKIFVPKFYIYDVFLFKLRTKIYKNRKFPEGVGIIEPHSVTKSRKKNVAQLKNKNILPKFNCVLGQTAQDTASFCREIASIYNIPYILAEHGPFPWPGSLINDVTADAIEHSDLFFAISNDKIRQILLQNINIKPWYIGNMVDDSLFKYIPSNNKEKVFIIVAAHSFYKNYDLFIRTMEYLKSIATKKFKIIVAGYNANKGYSKNAETLELKIRNSSILEDTVLIPSVARKEIPQLYTKADAFVMTSIQEGMPVSALEAAMCGLPIFSTCCGGVEDFVDETIGRIVSILDYKGLANVCNNFLNETIVFDSKKIRENIINRFGKKAFVENVTKAIQTIL